MEIKSFFESEKSPSQKQYDALRAFHVDGLKVDQLVKKYGYTLASFYSLNRDFKKEVLMKGRQAISGFFAEKSLGRKLADNRDQIAEEVIGLRKKYLSITDIKTILDSKNIKASEKHIYNITKEAGFGRLPKRSLVSKRELLSQVKISASISELLDQGLDIAEEFNTDNVGLSYFAPYIAKYGIDKIIEDSGYPQTSTIPRINSILSFLALKLVDVKRYTADDLWCMDRGSGLFAGLNVLPKASWFSSYSHRVTREMNINFLREMNKLWHSLGLFSDTANVDFVTVPYWGKDAGLENNWSGTRNKALTSVLAAICHDPDTGIMSYADATIGHKNQSDVILEFLDFYRSSGNDLKYLVFDSKLTTYQNLAKLDKNKVNFITIRKRGKKIVSELDNLNKDQWKKVRVKSSSGSRQLKVHESFVKFKEFDKNIRQIAITGHGKIKPALIITNDLDLSIEKIIEKYAQRWLVEKNISEQTHFFHLNKLSSSVVIKVDFDLCMTVLAHNLYRLIALDLGEYKNLTASSLYNKFIKNSGTIDIKNKNIQVTMRKKRNLPIMLSAINKFQNTNIKWMKNYSMNFTPASYS